jgi:uncharacterized protein (DUF927 family)
MTMTIPTAEAENQHESVTEKQDIKTDSSRELPRYYLIQVHGDPKFRLEAKSARKNGVRAEFLPVGWVYQNRKDAEEVAKRWTEGKRKLSVARWYDKRLDDIWNGSKHEASLAKKSISHELNAYRVNKKKDAVESKCRGNGLHHTWLSEKTIPEDMSEKDKKTHAYFKPLWDQTFEEQEDIDLRGADIAREEEDLEDKQGSDARFGDFIVKKSGVYHSPLEKTDDEDDLWICSPIWPEAHLRGKDGRDHGLLLKMHDGEREHLWAMPKSLITKIADINEVLLGLGQLVPVIPQKQKHLQAFLMQARPSKKMRCVDKSGWHGQQYIFPDGQVIGKSESGEGVYPQNDICPRGVEERGTLQEWQDNVFRLCKGNSRLLFSIGAAFASLCLIDEDSGGFNLKGRSSIGKTKCLRVAISVIGSREYQRSWKTTSNGLEGVCALHNDSLLPLDEFGQQDAAEAGEIAYMVANGVGKQRASRDGSARDPRTWRVMILSTGETGLEAHMHEGKRKARAGQLARITDVPADAGEGLGCFENVHELNNGAEFADELDRLCNKYYGTPARVYIQKIVEHGVENARRDIRFAADDFVAGIARKQDGQVQRVARRFGLVYAALALATKLGITPGLTEEESKAAVTTCYRAWLADRGTGGDMEAHSLIEQVKGLLEENAESKFAAKNDTVDEKRIRNTLWGYRDKATFYLLKNGFKSICSGYECVPAAKILIEEGLLIPDGQNRSSQSLHIHAHFKYKARFYVINLPEED